MTDNTENPLEIGTSSKRDLAGSCQIDLNDSGTCEKIDPPLTQRRSPTVRGFVYFIKAGNGIKIGFSTRPLDRLRELQTANPDKLEILFTKPGSRDFEAELHAHFDDLRIRKEWFRAEEPLLTYILQNSHVGVARFKAVHADPPGPRPSVETLAMIKGLTAIRKKHGAKSRIGHRCSNICEMMKELPPGPQHRIEYLTADGVKYQRNRLLENIEQQSAELAKLLAA